MSKISRVQIFFTAWIILVLIVSACQDPLQEAAEPVLPPATAVRDVLPTLASPLQKAPPPTAAIPALLSSPTSISINPTPMPTNTQTSVTKPAANILFTALRFAAAPDRDSMGTFPAGTAEIYAIWEYSGITATDNVRRIWFRDDQIWLVREELWDSGRYGAAGTVLDVSVYDNEGTGLPPGNYRLQLYVNDALQQEGSFVVEGQ